MNTGHGHVFKREDGITARCGGPGICDECSRDLAVSLRDGNKVTKLDDARAHFNWFAMCVACRHRWIATTVARTSLFALECPKCGRFDSFASPIPEDYLDEVAE